MSALCLCLVSLLPLQVKSRQLWGEDTYTDDSDLVAVLLHLGYYASSNVVCNPMISRFYAQVTLLPPQEQYLSCTRNAVRSRCWFAKIDGCSYQVTPNSKLTHSLTTSNIWDDGFRGSE